MKKVQTKRKTVIIEGITPTAWSSVNTIISSFVVNALCNICLFTIHARTRWYFQCLWTWETILVALSSTRATCLSLGSMDDMYTTPVHHSHLFQFVNYRCCHFICHNHQVQCIWWPLHRTPHFELDIYQCSQQQAPVFMPVSSREHSHLRAVSPQMQQSQQSCLLKSHTFTMRSK